MLPIVPSDATFTLEPEPVETWPKTLALPILTTLEMLTALLAMLQPSFAFA